MGENLRQKQFHAALCLLCNKYLKLKASIINTRPMQSNLYKYFNIHGVIMNCFYPDFSLLLAAPALVEHGFMCLLT